MRSSKAVLQTPTGINIHSKCVLSEFEQVPLHELPKVNSLRISLNVATHTKHRQRINFISQTDLYFMSRANFPPQAAIKGLTIGYDLKK